MVYSFPYFEYASVQSQVYGGYQFTLKNTDISHEIGNRIESIIRRIGEYESGAGNLDHYLFAPFKVEDNSYCLFCSFDFKDRGYLNRIGSLRVKGYITSLKEAIRCKISPLELCHYAKRNETIEDLANKDIVVVDVNNLNPTIDTKNDLNLSDIDIQIYLKTFEDGGYIVFPSNKQGVSFLEYLNENISRKTLFRRSFSTFSNSYSSGNYFNFCISPQVEKPVIEKHRGKRNSSSHHIKEIGSKDLPVPIKQAKREPSSESLYQKKAYKNKIRGNLFRVTTFFLTLIIVWSIGTFFYVSIKYKGIKKDYIIDRISGIEFSEKVNNIKSHFPYVASLVVSDLEVQKAISETRTKLYNNILSLDDIECEKRYVLTGNFLKYFPEDEKAIIVHELYMFDKMCVEYNDLLIELSNINGSEFEEQLKLIEEYMHSNHELISKSVPYSQKVSGLITENCCSFIKNSNKSNNLPIIKKGDDVIIKKYLNLCPTKFAKELKEYNEFLENIISLNPYTIKLNIRKPKKDNSVGFFREMFQIIGGETYPFYIVIKNNNNFYQKELVFTIEENKTIKDQKIYWSYGDEIQITFLNNEKRSFDYKTINGEYAIFTLGEMSISYKGVTVDLEIQNKPQFKFNPLLKTFCDE